MTNEHGVFRNIMVLDTCSMVCTRKTSINPSYSFNGPLILVSKNVQLISWIRFTCEAHLTFEICI